MKRSFEMPVDEIVMNYRQSKNKSQQVEILAQLNICKPWEIIWVLVENGVDPRSFNKSAFLRNSYEMAKEKGLQPPAKKLSDINAEITSEEAPEQNPEPDEKVVIIPETENETVTEFAVQINDTLTQEDEITGQILVKAREAIHEKANVINAARVAESEEVNRVMDQCTIESLSEAVERLEEENESLKGVIEIKDKSIQELLTENAELKKSLAHHKVSDFNATTDSMQKELEIKKLKESIAFYSDEREGDGLTIASLKHENEELKTKVTAAEHYILNMLVYGNPFS